MNERYKKGIIIVFFSIVLLLLLLLLSYKILLFFTPLTSAQENVFQFLAGKQDLQADFTESEVSHLEDVKQVMSYANYFFYAFLLTLTVIITYYRKDKEYLFQLLNQGGKVTVAVMLLLGVLSFFFFNVVFTVFHQIFFPQGNWQFAADSLLIQTFPLDFFVNININIFLLALFLGMLFILIEYLYRYVLHYRN